MDLEVVTVGTELLLGFTLDGNTADIARMVSHVGCNVVRSSSIPDDETAICDAVLGALDRTGLVVVTGGLGPTVDDMTKKAVAKIFDSPLELDVGYLEELKARFARLGKGPMPDSNRRQAELPRGAAVLVNPIGTAPGLWLQGPTGSVIMLPGVPQEMRSLMEAEVVPRLRRMMRADTGMASVTRSRTLRTTGISESRLADQLREAEASLGNVVLSYLPGVEGVDLRLTVRNVAAVEADDALSRAEHVLRPILAGRFYGHDTTTLAEVLVQRLHEARLRLAVAESCTGGLIGAQVAAVPGASRVFAGGVICYEDASKVRDLSVRRELLLESGSVSEAVARAMADGVCERFGADVGLAATGIAGPGGGTESKPVGTVWVAARLGAATRAVGRWFPGDRGDVRARTAQAALDLVRMMLDGS